MQRLQLKRRKQPRTDLYGLLNLFFGSVGLVLITQQSRRRGIWKEGKTDFGLYLSQMLLHYGLVKEVASNINTYGHYPQIADLISLRSWLHRGNRLTKLYILDELNVHAPRRRAMSNKNIGILQIIPEISKARARIIGIGHDLLKVDKDLISLPIVRGLFIKKTRKNVHIVSRLFSGRRKITDIPRTTIPFDPYETAPFTERPRAEIMFKDQEIQKFYNYCRGSSWREQFKHPQECSRFVRRVGLKLCEKVFTDSQI